MIDFENKSININNINYEIIETIKYQNRIFAYLVNINDELDSMFKELVIENDMLLCYDIEQDLFKNNLIGLFIDKMSK